MRSLRIPSALRSVRSARVPTLARAVATSTPNGTSGSSPADHTTTASSASSSPSSETSTTHFGFQTVPTEQKAEKVHSIFASVASQYDLMNDLMSAGMHRLWKSHFVSSLNPGRLPGSPHPQTLLDVAGGTGDISFRLLEHATDVNRDSETKVICADINTEMLKEGERRLATDPSLSRWRDRVTFREENAETLESIPDASVDLYTISFGIRNVTDIPKALRTAHRVLKPGGVFAVLEFSRVRNPLLDALYTQYSFNVIPVMGQVVAGDRDGYQYLVESIRMFPTQERFAEMIREAGFKTSGQGFEALTFGVANIWKGVKV